MKQINLKSNNNGPEKTTSISLSLLIGSLLLIISGSVFGGLFLYQSQIEKNIGIAKNQMKTGEQNIDKDKFAELHDLQGRIIDIKSYLSKSSDQTEVLGVISSRTFSDTSFESLDLIQSSEGKSSEVSATIIVTDANRLVAQMNAYKQSDQIEDLKISDSSLEEAGTKASLSFTVKAPSEELEK